MQLRQLREVQAAEAAYHFLTQDPPPTSLANPSPGFQQQVSALKELIDAITARGADQKMGPRKERYSARNAAAAQLRDGTLRALRQVARGIAAGKEGAGLAPDFGSIVSVSDTRNIKAIIQDARSTAKHVAPYQALFIARGQAPDFLAELTQQTDAVEALAQDAHEARGTQLTATQDVDQLLRELRITLRCVNVEVRRLCIKEGPQGKAIYRSWQKLKRPHQASVSSDASDTANHPITPTPVGAATPASAGAAVQAATPVPATSTAATPVSTTPAAV